MGVKEILLMSFWISLGNEFLVPRLMKWSQDRGWVSQKKFLTESSYICSAIQLLTNIISIIQVEIFRVIRRIDSFRIAQLQSLQYENSSNWCFSRHWPRDC